MTYNFPFHPISENDVKCRISEGCFFALGSSAYFLLEKVTLDNDNGTDFRLNKLSQRNGKTCDCGNVLDFQLKATANWKIKNKHIEYSLKSKNYNDIITRNKEGAIPLILVVMCMPTDARDRVAVLQNFLVFQRNLYWFHTNSTDLLANENSTKLIRIPTSNLLTPKSFGEIVTTYCTKVAPV